MPGQPPDWPWRITAGADVASVSEALGHSDKAVTLRMYTHADAESYSVFAMLGMLPPEAGFSAVELRKPELAAEYERRGLLPPGLEVFASSDAHFLSAVGARLGDLAPNSVLRRLL